MRGRIMNRRSLSAVLALGAATGVIGGALWPGFERRRAAEARRKAYQERVASIERLSARGKVAQAGMDGFLRFWSDAVVARQRPARFTLDALQSRRVREGSLLLPPADAAQIEAWAPRFGLELPPSLRALYAVSDGMRASVEYGKDDRALMPAARLRWLHEEDAQLVQIWQRSAGGDASDADYHVYGERQDVARMRPSYMSRMVCLGPVVDGGVLLLNPAIRFADGEFEAWDFSVKYPGARRYRSLAELLEARCESDCWTIDEWSATHDLAPPAQGLR
jgi:hypothetical protein